MPSVTQARVSESHIKHRYINLKQSIDTISAHATQQGLSRPTLERIFNAITPPSFIDQTSQSELIKCLYPKGKVQSNVVYIVVGSLGHGALKASLSTQQGLIKWLVMVYHVLEDPTVLLQSYGIFFNLLDTFSLRADLCRLLAKLTRKKHVKPFRLQMLQDLLRTVGQDPALLKLMTVYDKYAPGQLDLGRSKKRSSCFTHPDPEWRQQLEQIQSQVRLRRTQDAIQSDLDDPFARSNLNKPGTGLEDTFTRLESIDDSIDCLCKPISTGITIFDLQDPLFQKHATLESGETAMRKANELLSSLLQQQLDGTEPTQKGSRTLQEILENASAFTKHTKILPQSLISFFSTYLSTWDGHTSRSTILSLLTYLPLQPFSGKSTPYPLKPSTNPPDLYPTLLHPLEANIRPTPTDSAKTASTSTSPTTNTASLILSFYTSLLHNWTSHLLSNPPPNPLQTSTITSLTTHLTHLPLTLLTSTPPTQSITNLLLSYYHTLLPLLRPPLSIPLAPPLPQTTALLLLAHPTLPTLNTLASILAAYKTTYENSNPNGPETPPRPAAHVKTLNASLIDTLNLLLRSRAFNTTDPHSSGLLLPPHLITTLAQYTLSLSPPQPLTGLFTLSTHPALVGLSIAALREIEDAAEDERVKGVNGNAEAEGEGEGEGMMVRHAGPVTQRSLVELGRRGGVRVDWKEYRVAVLRWLEAMGASGLRELGEATMKGLMAAQTGGK